MKLSLLCVPFKACVTLGENTLEVSLLGSQNWPGNSQWRRLLRPFGTKRLGPKY